MRKFNTKKRKAMNIWQILAGLGLAAVVGGVVGPRLMNSDLPGIKSNVKTEINSVAEVVEQYLANHDGSAAGISWDVLESSGTVSGAMAQGISAAAGTNATYTPAWANGKLVIYLGPASSGDEKVNVFFDWNGANAADVEAAIYSHATVKFGTLVKGDSTAADAAEAKALVEGAVAANAAANTDGEILFTVQ